MIMLYLTSVRRIVASTLSVKAATWLLWTIFIASSDSDKLMETKIALIKRFDMTEFAKVIYFLGIETNQAVKINELSMRQIKFARSILHMFGKESIMPVKTP